MIGIPPITPFVIERHPCRLVFPCCTTGTRDLNCGCGAHQLWAPAQAIGATAYFARGGQARSPGLRNTSTTQTMPKTYSAAADLAPLLDGSNAGELIPELARYSLQQLIELEVVAVLVADCQERTEVVRLPQRNGPAP